MSQKHAIATIRDIPSNTAKAFDVAGRRIAIFNVEGHFYAMDDACTHDGGPLSEGDMDGTTVTCPLHGAEFDVTCGRPLCGPALEKAACYSVSLNGDTIEVEV